MVKVARGREPLVTTYHSLRNPVPPRVTVRLVVGVGGCAESDERDLCRTKRKVPSLAYLRFRTTDDVMEFFAHFHDHLFVSERGE
jgi:hypothetical protein